jgi:hypothetical protein
LACATMVKNSPDWRLPLSRTRLNADGVSNRRVLDRPLIVCFGKRTGACCVNRAGRYSGWTPGRSAGRDTDASARR